MENPAPKPKLNRPGNLTGQLVIFVWVALAIWLRWYTTSPLDQSRPIQTEVGEVKQIEENHHGDKTKS